MNSLKHFSHGLHRAFVCVCPLMVWFSREIRTKHCVVELTFLLIFNMLSRTDTHTHTNSHRYIIHTYATMSWIVSHFLISCCCCWVFFSRPKTNWFFFHSPPTKWMCMGEWLMWVTVSLYTCSSATECSIEFQTKNGNFVQKNCIMFCLFANREDNKEHERERDLMYEKPNCVCLMMLHECEWIFSSFKVIFISKILWCVY